MGNCATKPKVQKDSEEDLKPVEQESTQPEKTIVLSSPKPDKTEEDAAAAARRTEKGKDILIEDDNVNVNVDEHNKRQSLSLLFHEDKPVEKEVTRLSPKKPVTTSASSEVSKLDTSDLTATKDKARDIYDVETRTDLEVNIPNNSEVKTPETPTAEAAQEQKANFSENWEVKFPEELEAKKTTPEVVKIEQEPKPTDLSEIKVTKEVDVPEVLEDKKSVPEVRSKEVKAAESELLKVSEVKSSDDLEIQVPKVFEAKTPVTSNVDITDDDDEIKVKKDQDKEQEAAMVKIVEEVEFMDAQERIEKHDQDKEIVLEKEKDLSTLNK